MRNLLLRKISRPKSLRWYPETRYYQVEAEGNIIGYVTRNYHYPRWRYRSFTKNGRLLGTARTERGALFNFNKEEKI